MNKFHYYQDPLVSIARDILEGKTQSEDTIIQDKATLDEGVAEIAKAVSMLKVGDKTNFGVVVEISKDSITFKAKDLPKTRIPFTQRKTGSKDFVLDKLVKLKEETEENVNTISVNEAVVLASDTLKGQVLQLLALTSSLKVSHWKAATRTNEHSALGSLYDSLSDHLDAFAETEMGLSRSRNFTSIECEISAGYTIPQLISELQARAEALLSSCKVIGAEDLVNIAAEILGAINKSAYLLEV